MGTETVVTINVELVVVCTRALGVELRLVGAPPKKHQRLLLTVLIMDSQEGRMFNGFYEWLKEDKTAPTTAA